MDRKRLLEIAGINVSEEPDWKTHDLSFEIKGDRILIRTHEGVVQTSVEKFDAMCKKWINREK